MSSGTEEINRLKASLRAELLQRRAATHAARYLEASASLTDRFFGQFGDTLQGKTVAAYWPIGEEIDIRPVLSGLAARDAVAALPVTGGKTGPLSFRQWRPGDDLISVSFGVYEPEPGVPAADPDLVIVPLLGFDAAGNRIGYGGGYYDRTLASLRRHRDVRAVGVAYDEQECEKIPTDAGDVPLDMVLTDRRTIVPPKDESID